MWLFLFLTLLLAGIIWYFVDFLPFLNPPFGVMGWLTAKLNRSGALAITSGGEIVKIEHSPMDEAHRRDLEEVVNLRHNTNIRVNRSRRGLVWVGFPPRFGVYPWSLSRVHAFTEGGVRHTLSLTDDTYNISLEPSDEAKAVLNANLQKARQYYAENGHAGSALTPYEADALNYMADTLTRDNVTVGVEMVLIGRIIDAERFLRKAQYPLDMLNERVEPVKTFAVAHLDFWEAPPAAMVDVAQLTAADLAAGKPNSRAVLLTSLQEQIYEGLKWLTLDEMREVVRLDLYSEAFKAAKTPEEAEKYRLTSEQLQHLTEVRQTVAGTLLLDYGFYLSAAKVKDVQPRGKIAELLELIETSKINATVTIQNAAADREKRRLDGEGEKLFRTQKAVGEQAEAAALLTGQAEGLKALQGAFSGGYDEFIQWFAMDVYGKNIQQSARTVLFEWPKSWPSLPQNMQQFAPVYGQLQQQLRQLLAEKPELAENPTELGKQLLTMLSGLAGSTAK